MAFVTSKPIYQEYRNRAGSYRDAIKSYPSYQLSICVVFQCQPFYGTLFDQFFQGGAETALLGTGSAPPNSAIGDEFNGNISFKASKTALYLIPNWHYFWWK